MQPIEKARDGTPRFKRNAIVAYLLDSMTNKGMGLNEISRMPFSREDYEQLMQLIGYSVGGYDELSMVSSKSKKEALTIAEKLTKKGRKS